MALLSLGVPAGSSPPAGQVAARVLTAQATAVATNDAYYRRFRQDLLKGRPLAPVGVGVELRTGRLIYGWDHTVQSIYLLLATRYHERPMRYYVGSFVPAILGNNAVPSVITRFFWAVATAIDLWEPRYRILKVGIRRQDGAELANDDETLLSTTDEDIRAGVIAFHLTGVYMPRGHLGDFTPEGQRSLTMMGSGNGRWRMQ